jgi:LytS/YehU family sensor histidine kinase
MTKGFLILGFILIVATFIYWTFNYILQRRMSSFAKQVMLSDLRAIRAQMNPHFIFNSLNSINRYILKNETDIASDYLGRFAKLMRLVLDNSNHERITLATELEALQIYVELEQLRFEHTFVYEVSIEAGIQPEKVLVQPLIFQPILENAIWHGLMHKEEGMRKLNLNISEDNGKLICEIRDNGVGREATAKEKKLKKKSYGINLVRDRLVFLDINAELSFIDLKDSREISVGTAVILKFKKTEDYTI